MQLGINFGKYTWINRTSDYPNRRKLTKVDGSENLYDVERADTPGVEGTLFNAETMMNLENRIGEITVDIDNATQSQYGLMNTEDKKKLDGINIRPPAKSKFWEIQQNSLEANVKFIRRKSQKIKTLGPGSAPAV